MRIKDSTRTYIRHLVKWTFGISPGFLKHESSVSSGGEQLDTDMVRDVGDWFMILEEAHTHHPSAVSGIGDHPPLLGMSSGPIPVQL